MLDVVKVLNKFKIKIISSGGTYKFLKKEGYKSTEISKYTGLDIVVVGNFRSDDFKNTIDLRGELKLSELPAIIQKAEFIVTNDSAPLHIASALCTPTVALFGPTSFIKYGPYPQKDSMNRVISSRDGLMKSIPLQSVIEAVKDLVNR